MWISTIPLGNTYKHRIFPQMHHLIKDTKFAPCHQREILFSVFNLKLVHGLFTLGNSRVTTRWQIVMNIQLILLLKFIVLYLATRIGNFYETETQAITIIERWWQIVDIDIDGLNGVCIPNLIDTRRHHIYQLKEQYTFFLKLSFPFHPWLSQYLTSFGVFSQQEMQD